jgi:dTDP-4-dehydrorhamnose 3,5-epimerase
VESSPLGIDGAWTFTPRLLRDARGTFLEAFTEGAFTAAVGHRFSLAQMNCSVSDAGVLRGVHYADVPPGQAKYVTCTAGAVLDVVVDLRVGSPTFGRSASVLLDDVDRRAVYLAEGLGHAFCAVAPASTVVYACSTGYAPEREHGVHPLDPALGIAWPTHGRDGAPLALRLSPKDEAAPTLAEAEAQGLLPRFDAVAAHVRSLP